ncbi:MAG: fluoride efflux transporter CrcB [Marinilabiliales bacterium]|nr:MAG: fluoride efflux transporter CrcB [Marinilabiliales bacterium]
MLKQILFVGLGGGAGSILRYMVTLISAKNFDFKFPVHTFAVNILGSFIIGLIMGYLHKAGDTGSSLRYLIAIGFCGGFTTFSSFAFENINLFSGNNTWTALIYISSSIILCLLAVILGMQIIK